MSEFCTVGVDLAKNVIQVHGVDANGKVVVRRQLRRSRFLAFFEGRPLDSHFKCDTELLSEGLDWRLESEAFSRG